MVVIFLEREPTLAFHYVSSQQNACFTNTSSLSCGSHTVSGKNILSVSDYVEVWAVFIDLHAYSACAIYTVPTTVVLFELELFFFRDN
jgi:hypothetical protein